MNYKRVNWVEKIKGSFFNNVARTLHKNNFLTNLFPSKRHSERSEESLKKISKPHDCIPFNTGKILKQVQDDSATHVDTLGLPSTRHPEALAEGATHVSMFDKNRRVAFTLAEVLITLGIIGVVAALTIPTLISKFQEKALESQFKKTYSMLSQALQFTIYENGSEYKCYTQDRVTNRPDPNGTSQFEYSECTKFHKSFFQNLKYVKVEFVNEHPYKTRNEVVAEGGTVSNNSCNFSFVANTNKYYLQDGSIVYALTNRNSMLALYFVIDINGDKGPNKWGYDVFYLGPTKQYTGVLRIAETTCLICEKGGKSVEDILKR